LLGYNGSVNKRNLKTKETKDMITLPEAEAKARLTAAAPDLLAALVEMVFLYADHAQYDDEEGHEKAGINAALAAIARAKGQELET
jgi:hypothetical protein